MIQKEIFSLINHLGVEEDKTAIFDLTTDELFRSLRLQRACEVGDI